LQLGRLALGLGTVVGKQDCLVLAGQNLPYEFADDAGCVVGLRDQPFSASKVLPSPRFQADTPDEVEEEGGVSCARDDFGEDGIANQHDLGVGKNVAPHDDVTLAVVVGDALAPLVEVIVRRCARIITEEILRHDAVLGDEVFHDLFDRGLVGHL